MQPLIINLYVINYFELHVLFAIFVSVTKDAVVKTIQTFCFYLISATIGEGIRRHPSITQKPLMIRPPKLHRIMY